MVYPPGQPPPGFEDITPYQGPTGGAPGSTSVWLGGSITRNAPLPPGHEQQSTTGLKPVSVTDATESFWQWSDAKRIRLQNQLDKAGITATGIDGLYNAWSSMVDMAAKSYDRYMADPANNKKPMTPWQVLEQSQKFYQNSLEQQAAAGPTTSTESRTDTLSASGGRALDEQSFQTYLGRDPRAGEYGGSPRSSTAYQSSTTTPDGEGNSSTSTSATQGADLAQLSKEYAQSRPDYAEYQAATTYWNALLGAVGRMV
jgi:hypothetical protein